MLAAFRGWWDRQPGNFRGIFWVGLSGIMFALLNAATLYPAQHLNPWMMSFLRYCFGPLFFFALIPLTRTRFSPRTRKLPLHAGRAVLHAGGITLWFIALPHVDLAGITALGFTGPIFVIIGAALFLREAVSGERWLVVLLGFVGALIILRPGFVEISLFVLAALGSAPLFAGSNLIAKHLARTETAGTIVFWQNVWIPVFCLPMAYLHWQPILPADLLILIFAGLLGTLGHLVMQRGYQIADLTALQPIGFLALVWNALFGFVFFGQRPDVWTFIGAAVIFGSATYFSRREQRRRAATLPPRD